MAIIKHANPCGIAIGADVVADAHRKAHDCDPVSRVRRRDRGQPRRSPSRWPRQVADIFTEVIVAPGLRADGAVEVLARKKNIRVLRGVDAPPAGGIEIRADQRRRCCCSSATRSTPTGDDPANWTLAAGEPADAATLADLVFAWRACRAVKSNAILLAHGRRDRRRRHGPGQPGRLGAARGRARAGDRAARRGRGLRRVLPVPRRPARSLIDAGVRAIVQPGGSVRDDEVIAAAAAAGVTLYLTGTRHFFH